MKKIFVLLAFVFSSIAFAVTPKDIPAPVKAKFAGSYPLVTNAKWSKVGKMYQADFTAADNHQTVKINAVGTIIETREDIKRSDLPVDAAKYMKKHYASKPIHSAVKITNEKGQVVYQARTDSTSVLLDGEGHRWRSLKKP